MRDGRPMQSAGHGVKVGTGHYGTKMLHTGFPKTPIHLNALGVKAKGEHSARTKSGAGGYGTGATVPHRLQPTKPLDAWSRRGKIRRGYDGV